MVAAPLGAQSPGAPPYRFDLTALDAPYNISYGGRAPSMRQSLELTSGTYELVHNAIERAFGRRRVLGRVVSGAYDVLSMAEIALPLTDVWVHEEFHRAQLGRRGIGSFDDVYKFDPGATTIAVSHLRDEDIAGLKANHPAEWVRVNEAGMEGEVMLVRDLETRDFLGKSRGWHIPLYWIAKLSTAGYIFSSTADETESETDQMNQDEGADVPRRDFTGHDFLAWVYDLHRPNEPYSARGIHPSGIGIDRYIKPSDLTPEERRFIDHEARLHLLNFADPFLLGFGGIRIGGTDDSPRVATASLSHLLTSFGHTVDAQVLVQRGSAGASFIAHAYRNASHTFPGVEAMAFDIPARIGSYALELTPRVSLWVQPENQEFRTGHGRLGGLASMRLRTGRRATGDGRRTDPRVGGFVEVEAKSAGWVAASPYLNGGLALRTGVSLSAARAR